jgi:cytochrome c553
MAFNRRNWRARRVLKWGALVLGGLAVLAGILLGPMLLDYRRFDQAVEATSTARAAAGGQWPRRSDACMPCHGMGGNTASPGYARLAGQPKEYVVAQLTAFASGERPSAVMSPLALELSPEEISALGEFFESRPVTGHAPFAVDSVRAKKGELLVKSGTCIACHGAVLQGQGANPRLAGQGSDYLAKQLLAFKSGARRDRQGVMAAIAAAMSEDEVESVAHYLATFRTR